MALVVLFSTFSFTVAQHYCGDDIVNFSFFGKAKSCGMEIQQSSNPKECDFTKKHCCDDETLTVAGQHDLKLSLEKLSLEQQQFVFSFVYGYLNLFEGLQENIVSFNHHPPPLLVKDIQILDQIFLI